MSARRTQARGEGGQSMVIVISVILLLSLGSVILAQNVQQHGPIVTRDLIQHEAYRAMETGMDEYLYLANQNPDYVTCTQNVPGSGCSGLSFDAWTPVPSNVPSGESGPPAWFLVDAPSINRSTGVVKIDFVGLSGYSGEFALQHSTVTLKPLNNYLLNLLWINYDIVKPSVAGDTSTCTPAYYYDRGDSESGCQPLSFISADQLTGPVFLNDSVFVCGNPTFSQGLTTGDSTWERDLSGCSNTEAAPSPLSLSTATESPVPSDSQLLPLARSHGCLYEGPTTIVLSGTTMTVTSPDTPTGHVAGAPGTSNDGIDGAGNANQCMPTQPGNSVPLPSNGVIYVEGCTSNCTGVNPVATLGEADAGSDPNDNGDAIVQGSIGPNVALTIASANNIIVDGDVCYDFDTSCPQNTGSTNFTSQASVSSSNDILGLIAQTDVEVNAPVGAPLCNGSNSPDCDLENPTIDAVSLALQGSVMVNDWGSVPNLGKLTVNGTWDEDFRGPVGTFGAGGGISSGYAKQYNYDSRERFLSPPYYLDPSTSMWGVASATVPSETCTTLPSGSSCPALPV